MPDDEVLLMEQVTHIVTDPQLGNEHTMVFFTRPKWGVWGVCSCGDDFGGRWKYND